MKVVFRLTKQNCSSSYKYSILEKVYIQIRVSSKILSLPCTFRWTWEMKRKRILSCQNVEKDVEMCCKRTCA